MTLGDVIKTTDLTKKVLYACTDGGTRMVNVQDLNLNREFNQEVIEISFGGVYSVFAELSNNDYISLFEF